MSERGGGGYSMGRLSPPRPLERGLEIAPGKNARRKSILKKSGPGPNGVYQNHKTTKEKCASP